MSELNAVTATAPRSLESKVKAATVGAGGSAAVITPAVGRRR
ncbi:hypothetical protein ACFOW4_13875 [Micromonospora sp. GCM10011542]